MMSETGFECSPVTQGSRPSKVVWVVIASSKNHPSPMLKVFATLAEATEGEIRDRMFYGWGNDVSTCIERHEIL